MILPGATLGMLGGGQLGRMFVSAAHEMGYQVIVLDPDPKSPAGKIADQHLATSYDDENSLQWMLGHCAAITTEFENIPLTTLQYFEDRHKIVRPSAHSVAIAQNRIREKSFIREHGFKTAPFVAIEQIQDIEQAARKIDGDAILKVATLGYDGKGQKVVKNQAEIEQAFREMGQVPCVLEKKLQLKCEISVILCRSSLGKSCVFPVAENRHKNGILDTTRVPSTVAAETQEQARTIAISLADAMNYCGVLAVEFFITRDGALLINEIAPRPHNSGHYTIDACTSSQFEQQLRMLCDLPAANCQLLTPVIMQNLLGDVWGESQPRWSALLVHDNVRLHLYAKDEARVGRKMGHYCVVGEDMADLEASINRINQTL